MHAWSCRECTFEIIFGLARFFDLTSKHKLNFHAKANFGDISVLNATLVWTIRFVVLSGLSIVTGNVS